MKRLILLTCVLLTIWAYWPSLQHAPKHDQLGFMGDIALRPTVWDKTVGVYSWNRDRLFMGPDEFLFRPLLNLFLAAQLRVFGYNFVLWQAMGIFLHLVVGVSMYRLLSVIRPGLSASFAAGFFLLMLSNLPMVVWHNISAYLLFSALILEAVRSLVQYEPRKNDQRLLWSCAGVLLTASFLFEAGIVFTLSCCLFAAFTFRPRRLALIFILPVILYFFFNFMDFFYHHAVMTPEGGRIAGQVLSLKTLMNAMITCKWFITSGLFLRASDIIPVERIVISYTALDPRWPFMAFTPHLGRGIAAIVMIGGLAVWSYGSLPRKQREIVGLLAIMIAGLTVFICFGRVNTRGIVTGLFFNSYYVYFFWVLALPAVYSLLSFDRIRERPDAGLIRAALYFLCGAFIFINVLSIRNANRMIARVDQPRKVLLDAATAFISRHHKEADLSFVVPHTCSGNYAGGWLHKQGDPVWRRYTLLEVLYPQYYQARGAKYRLPCSVKEWP